MSISVRGQDCYVDIAYNSNRKVVRVVGGADHNIFYTGEVYYTLEEFIRLLGVEPNDIEFTPISIADETEVLASRMANPIRCNKNILCLLPDDHLGQCYFEE